MPRKSTPAAEQFRAMGLEPSEWTEPMKIAVKQRWSNLPVDAKVDELRAQIAAVAPAPVPTVEVLQAQGFGTEDECRTEVARLKRNASVNAWRSRNQFQAALDARELKFQKRFQHRKAS
jgi:hypothetical protein